GPGVSAPAPGGRGDGALGRERADGPSFDPRPQRYPPAGMDGSGPCFLTLLKQARSLLLLIVRQLGPSPFALTYIDHETEDELRTWGQMWPRRFYASSNGNDYEIFLN